MVYWFNDLLISINQLKEEKQDITAWSTKPLECLFYKQVVRSTTLEKLLQHALTRAQEHVESLERDDSSESDKLNLVLQNKIHVFRLIFFSRWILLKKKIIYNPSQFEWNSWEILNKDLLNYSKQIMFWSFWFKAN